MCLAIPAQITHLLDDERAIVNVGGVEKNISISFLESVEEGDFVIVHVGYALTLLDKQEAEKTLALFAEMVRKDGEE